MSNHLAIAAVSAAIRQKVLHALDGVVANLDPNFDRPKTAPPSVPTVSIYLYGVSEDAAKRNADVPTRGADGALAQRPRAALVLHYLLVFYGDESKLEPQLMLGAVVRHLHAQPVLTTGLVTAVIEAQGSLVAKSDLHSAAEKVRLNLRTLSLEDWSRLWSVMVQAPYALSLACDAGVVLIDALDSTPTALPALRRGDEDRGPEAQAAVFPRIDSLWVGLPGAARLSPLPPSLPAAELGAELIIAGANLGDAVRFEFKHPALNAVELDPIQIEPGIFRLDLPAADLSDHWAAGVYAVTAIAMRDGEAQRSALWPMALAPKVDSINPNSLPHDGGPVTVEIVCRPKVLPQQAALARLAKLEVAAAAHPLLSGKLSFTIDPAPIERRADEPKKKKLPFFLRVDGVDSQPFLLKPGTGFEFDEARKVEVQWP
ncbi:MAG: DUF4255 domain-containing protein [Allosphingosinicella sp.]